MICKFVSEFCKPGKPQEPETGRGTTNKEKRSSLESQFALNSEKSIPSRRLSAEMQRRSSTEQRRRSEPEANQHLPPGTMEMVHKIGSYDRNIVENHTLSEVERIAASAAR